MMLAAGDLLDDRYRLVERIAAGGMGDVWRATDEELGRTVAVKTLRLGVGHDAGFEERFRREARTMAGLRHPGVAPVYDYRETSLPGGPDLAYIVMACVTGQPLSESLAQNGRFDVMTTMSIVGQAARALQSVHESGVVHRDVKPANLIVEPDGHLVLVDFGVALTKGLAGMTDADVVVGTALYMAPERVTRAPVGPAADIYALGAVAYQCLAGEPPFGGAMALEVAMRHVDDNLPPLPDDVPVAAHRFVAVAMAKDPARRFASAAAMAEAVERVTDAVAGDTTVDFSGLVTPDVAPASFARAPAVRCARRRGALISAAAVAGVAVVVAIVGATGDRPDPIPPSPVSVPAAHHCDPTR
jgi:serine/threonine-protein kinase